MDLSGLADNPALLQFWTERHLCTLTTLRADGSPHVVPVGAALDLEHDCLWVITNAGSRKARNVAADPRVAIASVDGARWSSSEGRAVVADDAVEVARACERYASRYREPRENPTRVALRVSVTRVLAGASLR